MPSELWFVTAPPAPVLIVGSHQDLLYSESHGRGWAVARVHADAETPGDQGDLRSLFGSLLHSMGYRLEQIGVELPAALHSAITDRPASAVGYGTGRVLRIEGSLRYASSWRFGPYCAAVTIHDGSWVSLLAPQSDRLDLGLTSTVRPVSW